MVEMSCIKLLTVMFVLVEQNLMTVPEGRKGVVSSVLRVTQDWSAGH